MFSGLFSSIVQSPRSLLASHLAKALATYFVVDPSLVEANLVKDTKIVLRDITLRPQSISNALLIGGVEEIEFKWKWGGSVDGSTSFVREAELTIRGAKFRLIPMAGEASNIGVNTASPASITTTETEGASTEGQPGATSGGYMERLVQQIVDHLTLSITDVELVVETGDPDLSGQYIVAEAKSLKLLSHGRQKPASDNNLSSSFSDDEPAPPLSQRISLDMLKIDVVKGGVHHPLLNPFGYAASVRRVSGRRFLNFAYGLEVMGEILQQDDIVIHSGIQQISVLNPIIRNLMDNLLDQTPVSQVVVPSRTSQAKQEDSKVGSTIFTLPFPSLVVILPNGSKVKMPNCILNYSVDQTTFSLKGHEGIQINEQPPPFLQLSDGVMWCADFTKCSFTVEDSSNVLDGDEFCDTAENTSSSSTDSIANLHWDEAEMKSFFHGLVSLQNGTRSIADLGTGIYQKKKDCMNEPKVSTPWSVSICGQVSADICGIHGEKIEALLEATSFVFPTGNKPGKYLEELTNSGFKMKSSSFGGDTIFNVPSISLYPTTETMNFAAPIWLSVHSSTAAAEIQNFVTRLIPTDSNVSDAKQTELPFSIEAPLLNVSIAEPKATIIIQEIAIGREVKGNFSTIEWKEENTRTSGAMSGISFLVGKEKTIKIQSVDSFCVPGAIRLDHPLNGLGLKFLDSGLHIHLVESFQLNLEETIKPTSTVPVTNSTYAGNTCSPGNVGALPYPLYIRGKEVCVSVAGSAQSGQSSIYKLSCLDFTLQPDGNILSIESRSTCEVQLKSSENDWLNAKIQPTAVTLDNANNNQVYSIKCSGLQIGPSSHGHLSVSVPCFDVSSETKELRAMKPIDVAAESIGVVELVKKHLCCLAIPQLEDAELPKKELGSFEKGSNDNPLNDPKRWKLHLEGVNIALLKTGAKVCLGKTSVLDISGSMSNGSAIQSGVKFQVAGMCLWSTSDKVSRRCRISSTPIDAMMLAEDNTCTFKMALDQPVSIRFQSTNNDWIQAKISGMSSSLSSESGHFSVHCNECCVGPSSYGDVSADVSMADFDSCTRMIRVQKPIKVSMPSAETAQLLSELLKHQMEFLSELSSTAAATTTTGEAPSKPISMEVPGLEMKLLEMGATLKATDVTCHDSKVNCSQITVLAESGASASASGIAMATDEKCINVNSLDFFCVSGVLKLAYPLKGIKLELLDSGLHIDLMESLQISLDETVKPTRRMHTAHSTYGSNNESVDAGTGLPFPVHIRGKEVSVSVAGSAQSGQSSIYKLSCLDFTLQPDGNLLNIESRSTCEVQLKSSENDWLNAKIQPTAVTLDNANNNQVYSIKCSGLQIGPSSHGHLSVSVPCFDVSSETKELRAMKPIDVTTESISVVELVKKHLCCLAIPQLEDAELPKNELGSFEKGSDGNPHDDPKRWKLHLEGVNIALLKTGAKVCLGKTSVLDISGSVSNGSAIHSGVKFQVVGMCLWSTSDKVSRRCRISSTPIDAMMLAEDNTSTSKMALDRPVSIRFQSTNNDWIQAKISGMSSSLSSESGHFSVHCNECCVGPSSYGDVSADVSMADFDSCTRMIRVQKPIKVSMPSAETAQLLSELLKHQMEFLSELSSTAAATTTTGEAPSKPISMEVPGLEMKLLEMGATLKATDVTCHDSKVNCSQITVLAESGASASASGIELSMMMNNFEGAVRWIDSIYIPGVCSLCEPMGSISLSVSSDTDMGLLVSVPSASFIILDQSNACAQESESSGGIVLPIPVCLMVEELNLKAAASEGNGSFSVSSSLYSLAVQLEPTVSSDNLDRNRLVGTDFSFAFDRLENDLVNLGHTVMSGRAFEDMGSFVSVTGFVFKPTSVRVTAGFSSVEWSSMFSNQNEGKKDKRAISLPCATIESFSANVEYCGKVLSTKTALTVAKFVGGPTTTSDDIIQYITNSVLKEIPSFFGNAAVLGENVTEMTAKNVGRAVIGTSLAGSMGGSIAGLVAVDSVKGAISSGKKARGEGDESRYKFGDLSRGAIRAVGETAKTGAKNRRGEEQVYRFGDFSAGSVQSVKQYSQNNKSRLAGAGGSGVGMVIGGALAGPVGMIAGSYIGGRAGSKTFEEEDKTEKPQEPKSSGSNDLLGISSPQFNVQQDSACASASEIDPFAPAQTNRLPVVTNTDVSMMFNATAPSADNNIGSDPMISMQTKPLAGFPGGPTEDLLGANNQLTGEEVRPYCAGKCQQQCTHVQTADAPRQYSPLNKGTPQKSFAKYTSNNNQQTSGHSQYQPQTYPPPIPPGRRAAPQMQQPRMEEQQEGYHFGDFTRSVVAKGKKKQGRSENDGYKFGDFTRGLFGK